MKIQSAGRLGNQLFIFLHALDVKINSNVNSVGIFADKFHSQITQELLDTFNNLSGHGIHFKLNNRIGFILRLIDKINSFSPKLSRLARNALKVQTEGMETLTEFAWVQRGYFQDQPMSKNALEQMNEILARTLERKISYTQLNQRMPFLKENYQAIHIRRTDFFSTEYGVIDPNSQLACLENDLKVVICTDDTKEEISKRIDTTDIEVITPNESTAWETLAILSRAENLVMTNSTLSFWAGFVASQNGKRVCAPSVWSKTSSEGKKLPFIPVKNYIPNFENL